MCKIKSIDTMSREEQEAAYEHALGLSVGKIAIQEYHATTIKPTHQCPHCGLFLPFTTYNRHERNCILSKISLEELEQEWFNPTMNRNSFAKKLMTTYNAVFESVIRLQEGGIMKYGDINWNTPCPYCGLSFSITSIYNHKKTCILATMSLEEFISEYTTYNPLVTYSRNGLDSTKNRYYLDYLNRQWDKFKEAGMIPAQYEHFNRYQHRKNTH